MWTSYVGSASKAPRPEFTVMISIPFFEAFVSGSLSALASGTDVAITCAPAPIAALIPATCLATSLFAYTCVTVTPRDFRSFAAWSTPFLKTDQNEPVSPCVTIATLILPACEAPNAAAGAPRAVRPAAAIPPLTRRPRRESCVSSSFVSRTSSFIVCRLLCRGRRVVERFSTCQGFGASHLLDRDGTPLGARPIGGKGDDERGACLREGAGASASVADGADELAQ